MSRRHSKQGHLKHFGARVHTFDKALVGVEGISIGTVCDPGGSVAKHKHFDALAHTFDRACVGVLGISISTVL